MDETQVIKDTLNTMLKRHAKVMEAYEVEITNMTAEIYRLKALIAEMNSENQDNK